MSRARYIALHLGVQMMVRLSGLVSGVMGAALLTRDLSHIAFGEFSIALTISGLATGLVDLGLNSAAVRELSVGGDDTDIAAALRLARTATALVSTLIAITISLIVFDWGHWWWPCLLVFLPLLLSPLTTGQAALQSQLRLGAQNAILLLQSWLWPIGVVIVWALDGSVTWFAIAYAVAAGLNVAFVMLFTRGWARGAWRGGSTGLHRILRVSIPFGISGLFITAYYRVGALILFHSVGAAASAEFSAAFRLIDALQVLPATILVALLPLMSSTFASDDRQSMAKGARYFSDAVRLALIMSVPIACGGAVLGRPLMRFLYGGSYAGYGTTLALLLCAFPPICLGYVAMSSVMATGHTRPLIAITAAAALINTAACLVFIPGHGAPAAAAITLATEWVVATTTLAWLRRSQGFSVPLGWCFRLACASAVMAGVVLLVRNQELWIPLSAGVAVFGIAALALRVVSRSDWALLRKSNEPGTEKAA